VVAGADSGRKFNGCAGGQSWQLSGRGCASALRCDFGAGGEAFHRPERALQLMAQGFGGRLLLDVPTQTKIYEFTQIQLAENYIRDLPQKVEMSVCPIQGLSTRDKAKDMQTCLAHGDNARVLIVTSDFHTRRALSIFRREVPGHLYAMAASRDDQQFGVRWWTHRQWAKTFINEWLRLSWWEAVDKWR
jgi:hypothetical protein